MPGFFGLIFFDTRPPPGWRKIRNQKPQIRNKAKIASSKRESAPSLVEPGTWNVERAGRRLAPVGYNGRMIFRKKKRLTEMVDCAG
jgi:hypothetical protein